MDGLVARDINNLSTADLVLCWGVVHGLMVDAECRHQRSMASEFRQRLEAIDREIDRRQLSFEDEVANLRASNDLRS